jgi:predicted regulator of Ras-like GTPase activity (Roadblock/LC7/MglB family)
MTDLEDILARSWARIEGCRVAAVAGLDGLLIERHPNPASEPALYSGPDAEELDHIVADVTTLFGVVGGAMSRQLGTPIRELIAIGESGGYLAKRISEDIFCLLLVGNGADLENIRREAEVISRELSAAFV